MSTISHEPSRALPERRPLLAQLLVRDMWTALAISVMWLAVLFDAVYGPDIVTATTSTSTRIPSAVFVALFAALATRAVARYGFRQGQDDDGRSGSDGSP
jgi:hypothetical protein